MIGWKKGVEGGGRIGNRVDGWVEGDLEWKEDGGKAGNRVDVEGKRY